MLILLTREDVARLLDTALPFALKTFLRLRVNQLQEARFIIVQPTDRLSGIEALLGYSLFFKTLPAWDWAMDHGSVIEVVFNISDDMTDVLIIPDDGTKPTLIAVLRQNAITPPSPASAPRKA